MISNRSDTKIYEVCFNNTKNATGFIETNTFTNDITDVYCNA